MSKKKTPLEKQTEKLNYQKAFNASFLHLYKTKLNEEKASELNEYSKNHSKEEVIEKEKNLDVLVEAKLETKASKLQAKLEKKEKHYQKSNNLNSKRIWEIDLIRGIVIIGMLIDHFFFDFVGLFVPGNFTNLPQFYLDIGSFAQLYWVHPVRIIFRLIGIFFLFFVSGISANFSKNSLLRSFVIIAAGGLMSVAFIVVSQFTSKEDLVIMGAIAAIGVCMLIYSIYKLIFGRFKHVFKWLTLLIAVGILVWWYFMSKDNVKATATGVYRTFWFYYNGYAGTIPVVRFANLGENIGSVLLGTKYFGSDWMGLFPALGYTFLGAFVGETLYKDRKSIFGKYNESLNRHTKLVIVPGRYSLWFYLLHQIIYIIIIGGLALIMGAQLAF